MEKTYKSIFVLLLSFSVYAQTATAPSGTGTELDPYEIATLDNLYWLSQNSSEWNKYFIQTADIDASATSTWDDGDGGNAEGFSPIGNVTTKFTGNYDGQNHTIDNLYINRSSSNIGLFGAVSASVEIKNLGLTNIDFVGADFVGGLIGWALNVSSLEINNCYTTGSVEGYDPYCGGLIGNSSTQVDTLKIIDSYSSCTVSAGASCGGLVGDILIKVSGSILNSHFTGSVTANNGDYAGGLVGYLRGSSGYFAIQNSYSTGSVSGTNKIGGLVGHFTTSSGSIKNSYSTGTVTGDGASVGGLVGYNQNAADTLSNCYSFSSVDGGSGSGAGGLVGRNDGLVINSYSTGSVTSSGSNVGGLVGINNGTVSDSFWDNETSGQTTSAGGTGKPTFSMKMGNIFLTAGWDNSIWSRDDDFNNGYPALYWQNPSGTPLLLFFSGGSGTSDDPFLISTKADLKLLTETSSLWGYYFKQINDITFLNSDFQSGGDFYDSGSGFSPIGNITTKFTGSYDGQNFTIDNLYINRPAAFDVGFFGAVKSTCVIKNLGLTNVDVTGFQRTGGLLGRVYKPGGTEISNCYTTGSVVGNDAIAGGLVGLAGDNNFNGTFDISDSYSNCTVNASSKVGGLVGEIQLIPGSGSITNSHATGTVSSPSGGTIGGLVASITATLGFTIENSYSTGSVSGPGGAAGLVSYFSGWGGSIKNCYATGSVETTGNAASGLVNTFGQSFGTKDTLSNSYSSGSVTCGGRFSGGLVYWNDGIINNCYSLSSVVNNSDNSTNYVGGLVGNNSSGEINYSYSAGSVTGNAGSIGGLVGANTGTVNNSFWDTETSGQDSSAGGTGKTTFLMKNGAIFLAVGWDNSIWYRDDDFNNGYPALYWQNPSGTPLFSFSSGSGTSADPFLISTKEDLSLLTETSSLWDSYYLQTDDITFLDSDFESGGDFYNSGNGFLPIGNSTTNFTGSYNGQNHTIDNLKIIDPSTDVGFFGVVGSGVVIKNLGLTNIDISGSINELADQLGIGGLVGRHEGGTINIDNCFTSGTINLSTDPNGDTYHGGGLVAYINDGSGTITNSYSTISITFSDDYSGSKGGLVGIIGQGVDDFAIENCYAAGSVEGDGHSSGGLVGQFQPDVGSIKNSYATGNVNGTDNVGGLVGFLGVITHKDTVSNCYAAGSVTGSNQGIGGLVGDNRGIINNSFSVGAVSGSASDIGGLVGKSVNGGTVNNSFWDITSSGQTTSGGGEGKTTAEMKTLSTFTGAGWDFDDVWDMVGQNEENYPNLQLESVITADNIGNSFAKSNSRMIAFQSESGTIAATFEYVDSSYSSLPEGSLTIGTYWDISNLTGNTKIRLYYTAAQKAAFTGTPKIYHYTGGSWVELPTEAEVDIDGTNFYVETTNYYSSFSPVTVGDNAAPLPVELVSFEGYNTEDGVVLRWETATETNNYGFEVQKSVVSSQNSEENWETIGFIQGHGTTNSPKHYEFTDSELPDVDEVSYRLKQIDNDGTFTYSKTITVDLTTITSVEDEEMPTVYSLEQNYPNPFNPSTTIKFGLPENGLVDLRVYNILGEEVARLLDKEMQAGYHEFNFDASQLTSGMYIYKLTSGNFTQTKKMVLLR